MSNASKSKNSPKSLRQLQQLLRERHENRKIVLKLVHHQCVEDAFHIVERTKPFKCHPTNPYYPHLEQQLRKQNANLGDLQKTAKLLEGVGRCIPNTKQLKKAIQHEYLKKKEDEVRAQLALAKQQRELDMFKNDRQARLKGTWVDPTIIID